MERRRHKRFNTNKEILVSVNDAVMRGRMLNLSDDGCMIACDSKSASRGRKVTVTLIDRVCVEGEIIWANNRRIGVTFYRKLDTVTVRYFQMDTIALGDSQPLADQFGRDMPPMRPDRDFD